jgi:hypothetical protein
MATSPNYSWPEPDNTDLVKNGALAIRTAVNAIDASLVDLKGGTTGQVLAKASGTDMDFSWVAQDDSNAIQNAIVDAKGDLIAATANDTPARLAVGTDYGFLQADSTAATGLVWNNAAWISYTPTVTSSSGSITSYTSEGRYQRIGKTCLVTVTVSITNVGTASGAMIVTLPFTSKGSVGVAYMGTGRESNVTGNGMTVINNPNSNTASVFQYNNTTVLATSANPRFSLVFEVA